MAVDQALYQGAVLRNGLKIITEPMDHVRTVALGVWVTAGSRYEDAAHGGISHFIEHVLFKGTATRSALAIAEAMDAIGGQLNAFTDKEHTCYYLRVLSDHLAEGVDILADMLLHPAIDPEALEKERQVLVDYASDGGANSTLDLNDYDTRNRKLNGLFALVLQSPAYQLH